MTNELLYAILSMDAYNRGGGASLILPGSASDGVGAARLAGATDIPGDSFFAQTYTVGGNIVISYRGTDALFPDLLTGWFTGVGSYNTIQAQDAALVYQRANGNSVAPNPYITLTGHSLGGGLAGFIGEIYGAPAVIFDNMPFEAAAYNLFLQASSYLGLGPRAIG